MGHVCAGYMWNPLSWAMEVAAILAIILLDYPDFCLIIALLVMNATISYREEASADKVPAPPELVSLPQYLQTHWYEVKAHEMSDLVIPA